GVHLGGLLLEAPDELHLLEEREPQRPVPARRRGPCHGSCRRHCPIPPSARSSWAHQRIKARSSTSMRKRARKIATMMASPTATSAAATVITKNTITCPSAVP